MNISTTTQPVQVAMPSDLLNAKAITRIERFFMLFIIGISLFCVAYLLEGGNPMPELFADYQATSKLTLGFLAN